MPSPAHIALLPILLLSQVLSPLLRADDLPPCPNGDGGTGDGTRQHAGGVRPLTLHVDLDRLAAGSEHISRRYADVAVLAAAIEAYGAELAVERTQFYASAVRGRCDGLR